jgi:hypothetical protein
MGRIKLRIWNDITCSDYRLIIRFIYIVSLPAIPVVACTITPGMLQFPWFYAANMKKYVWQIRVITTL